MTRIMRMQTAESIVLWCRRAHQQPRKPGASVKPAGWQASGPGPGGLQQEMDLVDGTGVAGRAAGVAREPASGKCQNEVELGSWKHSQYHSPVLWWHRCHSAECWGLHLVLGIGAPVLYLETVCRHSHQSHQNGFSSIPAALCQQFHIQSPKGCQLFGQA